jgi:hypothetical protein
MSSSQFGSSRISVLRDRSVFAVAADFEDRLDLVDMTEAGYSIFMPGGAGKDGLGRAELCRDPSELFDALCAMVWSGAPGRLGKGSVSRKLAPTGGLGSGNVDKTSVLPVRIAYGRGDVTLRGDAGNKLPSSREDVCEERWPTRENVLVVGESKAGDEMVRRGER